MKDSGHRTAQTLRHAMGAAWRASHSDAALARPKPPIRSRLVSARANVSNTGVLSHKCRAHASSQSSLIMISFGATPRAGAVFQARESEAIWRYDTEIPNWLIGTTCLGK